MTNVEDIDFRPVRKYCRKCDILISDEIKIVTKIGSVLNICRPCKRSIDREYCRKNIERNRNRTRKWYKENSERSKNYQKVYRSTEEGKNIIKDRRFKFNQENPDWWRWKKKRDKLIRRSREKNITPLTKKDLFVLENFNSSNGNFWCEYCKNFIVGVYHLDHIVPLCRGGNNELQNLAIACKLCNLRKGKKLIEQFFPSRIEYFKNRF